MQSFVPFIYDIFTVGLFLYMCISCSRTGFVKAIAGFIGYLAAIFVAATAAKPLATAAYTALFRNGLVRSIEKKLENANLDTLPGVLLSLVESLPEGLLDAGGFDKGELVNDLTGLISGDGAGAAGVIADSFLGPFIILILKMALFLVVFWIVMFFVKRLVWVFGGINHIPLIGPVNRILGVAVGFVEACIMMFVVSVLLMLLITMTGGALSIKISGEQVTLASNAVFQRTIIFKMFVNQNPLDMAIINNTAGLLNSGAEAGGRTMNNILSGLNFLK